jgi:hypothetical protein
MRKLASPLAVLVAGVGCVAASLLPAYAESNPIDSLKALFSGTSVKERIIHGSSTNSVDPSSNWRLANDALKKHDYQAARKYFTLVAIVRENNPYLSAAEDYVGPKDKLFGDMVAYYDKVNIIDLYTADALRTAAKSSPEGSEERGKLENQAAGLEARIEARRNEVCEELAKRGRPCNGAQR